ncbi:terminal uridylyltransferase 4 isoform X3 [Rhizophagus irregularis DAOM 181602=DAOM 197198]|nr:terminal uridylyltransferase 4 isoform X3 [Rhizophagus irregularis DAOM 181602=DAOM 197198]
MELDKIHEFIKGLRPEFVVPVQSAMPQIVEEAMEKTQALETAFSMGMNLSIVERKISEGITAALSQMYTETKPTNPTPNNNNNNNQNKNNSRCYVCRRTRHIVKNCRQRNNQQNNNNRNNNGRDLRNVDCYNCGRKGHIFKNCRSPSSNNNKKGESANFRKSSNKNSAKRVNWKDLLEEIRPIEKPIQLLKRPIYVLNILYNNFRIYLSKQLQKNKTMYNLWQVEGGKVENPFNCDVYLTKVPDYQELQRTEPEKQGAWTITSFKQLQFMEKYNELIPTLVNYCTNILNQLIREEPAYLNQKERAKEALYGEVIVYGQPVNVLIDSGAVGCIISKRFLDKVNKGIELPTNIKIIDVTG